MFRGVVMGVRRGSSSSEQIELEIDTRFDAFYRSEHTRTVRLARLLTNNPDIAEDITHEAFVRVHRTHPTLTDLDNPAAYLHTTTVNLCHNHHRSTSRDTRRLLRLPPPPQSQPASVNEHDDLAALVNGLPYRQRAVLVLRYWLDLTEADIATHLGCRPGTVKSLHARAIAHIRDRITTTEVTS